LPIRVFYGTLLQSTIDGVITNKVMHYGAMAINTIDQNGNW